MTLRLDRRRGDPLVHVHVVLAQLGQIVVGLDALAQKLVKTLFRDLAAEGKTIFITTHTMSVAEAVCDRIAIINRGRIVAEGAPDDVKKLAAQPGGDLENVFLEITTAPEQQV